VHFARVLRRRLSRCAPVTWPGSGSVVEAAWPSLGQCRLFWQEACLFAVSCSCYLLPLCVPCCALQGIVRREGVWPCRCMRLQRRHLLLRIVPLFACACFVCCTPFLSLQLHCATLTSLQGEATSRGSSRIFVTKPPSLSSVRLLLQAFGPLSLMVTQCPSHATPQRPHVVENMDLGLCSQATDAWTPTPFALAPWDDDDDEWGSPLQPSDLAYAVAAELNRDSVVKAPNPPESPNAYATPQRRVPPGPTEMLRLALSQEDLGSFFPPPRKRLKGKQSHHGVYVERLLKDPAVQCGWPSDREKRRNGSHEYAHQLAKHQGIAVRSARHIASPMWRRAPSHIKESWAFFAVLMQEKKKKLLEGEPLPGGEPAPGCAAGQLAFIEVYGILVTWQTDLGIGVKEVDAMLADNLAGDDLARKLTTVPLFEEAYDDLCGFVARLQTKHSFGVSACCMELCCNARQPGRVHCHAFWGPKTDYWGWNSPATKIKVFLNELQWHRRVPDVRPMRPRGNRRINDMSANGLYYVVADKVGSMFRKSTMWPFDDHHGCEIPLLASIPGGLAVCFT